MTSHYCCCLACLCLCCMSLCLLCCCCLGWVSGWWCCDAWCSQLSSCFNKSSFLISIFTLSFPWHLHIQEDAVFVRKHISLHICPTQQPSKHTKVNYSRISAMSNRITSDRLISKQVLTHRIDFKFWLLAAKNSLLYFLTHIYIAQTNEEDQLSRQEYIGESMQAKTQVSTVVYVSHHSFSVIADRPVYIHVTSTFQMITPSFTWFLLYLK